jgi:hypothetical protein
MHSINFLTQQLNNSQKCKDTSKDSKDGKDCKDDVCPSPIDQSMVILPFCNLEA